MNLLIIIRSNYEIMGQKFTKCEIDHDRVYTFRKTVHDIIIYTQNIQKHITRNSYNECFLLLK